MKYLPAAIVSLALVLVVSVMDESAQAQYVTPYISVELTNGISLDVDVGVQGAFPSSPFAAAVVNSPSASASFQGLDDDGTPIIPPDTQGAVGPDHVMIMLNTRVRIQNRAGTTNHLTQTLAAWWADAGSFSSVFDPRVQYDPYQQRWIAVALTDESSASSSILIGVSQTSDPTGAWYKQKIDADPANALWADYPNLAFNKNWIIATFNMFNMSGSFSNSHVYVFNKTNLYAGGTNYTRTETILGGGLTPAVTYDTNLSTMYLLQTAAASFVNTNTGATNGYLRLWTITGSFGSEVLTPVRTYPTFPWTHTAAVTDFGPQTNSSVKIHCGDSRVQNVVYRNGYLWCAQTVFLPATGTPTRSAVQWWQVEPVYGSVSQVGRIEDSSGTLSYAYPSIAVNRFNDALIGYSTFSTNQYASASYSYRASSDVWNTFRPGVTLKAGEGCYYKTLGGGKNRWGDYSATVTDPVNDGDFWTLQEYAVTNVNTGASDGDGRWGVWWGNISVGIPTNDNFSASTLLTGSEVFQPGTNLRATSEPGEPSHAGVSDPTSVWYHWVAPTNGGVIVDTQSNSFETVLAVYTGSSVTNLTLLAADHGSGGGWASKLTFNATAGTTYHIAVASYYGNAGSFTLHLVPPVAPVFVSQPKQTNVVVGETVTLAATAAGSPQPAFQWQFQGTNLSGATTNSFTRVNVQTNDAGDYWLIASNASGSATSSIATMLVFTNAKATLSQYGILTNTYQFYVSGVTNRTYVVEASTNMLQTSNWLAQVTNISPYVYIDMDFTNFGYRFYRVKFLP